MNINHVHGKNIPTTEKVFLGLRYLLSHPHSKLIIFFPISLRKWAEENSSAPATTSTHTPASGAVSRPDSVPKRLALPSVHQNPPLFSTKSNYSGTSLPLFCTINFFPLLDFVPQHITTFFHIKSLCHLSSSTYYLIYLLLFMEKLHKSCLYLNKLIDF